MSGLVSRIKEKLHRRSYDEDSLTADETTRYDGLNTRDATLDPSPRPGTAQGPTRISLENSAFVVSRGGQIRKSTELRAENNNQLYNVHHIENENRLPQATQRSLNDETVAQSAIKRKPVQPSQDLVPERGSSQHVLDNNNSKNQQEQQHELRAPAAQSSDLFPERKSSLSYAADVPATHRSTQNSSLPTPQKATAVSKHEHLHNSSDSSMALSGSESDNFNDLTRTRSPLDDGHARLGQDKIAVSEHLRLPKGFHLGNSVTTHVTEEQRPAVTHETITKERTEIIQEAITRDIHIHHYYTYEQPVQVVEILPAKHFYLDPVTGHKTEIAAPVGWQLPSNMTPLSPNTDVVKGWTRHYVVNEQYPHGKHEPPPVTGMQAV